MFDHQKIDRLKSKRLCYHCVNENFIKNEIRTQGLKRKCSYCGKVCKSYSLDKMAERIETAFEQHYFRTSNHPEDWEYPLLADKELDYEWDRDGYQVIYIIMDAAEISEDAAYDIQQILEYQHSDFELATMNEETEFAADSYYEEKGANDWAWQKAWRRFEHSLKTETRFFSREAEKHLKSVFDGIDQMQTHDDRPLIINAGPGTTLGELYRARVFQKDENLKKALARPDIHLGSPPPLYAIPGRMNARGISVFYGANKPEVALSEVRPPVGSQVMVARFEIIRQLKLLDLTALELVSVHGSIFDPGFITRVERAQFLRNLSQKITKPVMPNDELFDYIATQAIADFLATDNNLRIDGIIFPSVQVANQSLNTVLFHQAAKVEEIEIPDGTEISAELGRLGESDWEPGYTVVEKVSRKHCKKKDDKDFKFPFDDFITDFDDEDSDYRQPTLKIDLESVMVHMVKAVKFDTEEYGVTRYRWEENENSDF